MTFDGLPERIADVQQYLRGILGDVDGADDVVLVASELTANAVRDSDSGRPVGSFTLQFAEFTDAWHIRIDDHGGQSSRASDDDVGTGLPAVARLARAWGMFGNSAGRTVWADVPYPKDGEAPKFCQGDVLRVREKPAHGILVQPPHHSVAAAQS